MFLHVLINSVWPVYFEDRSLPCSVHLLQGMSIQYDILYAKTSRHLP